MPHDCAPTVTRRQFIGCSAAAMAGLAAFGCLPTGGVRTSEQVATQALSRSALATVNVATTGVAKGIADIEGITHHHQPEIRSICHCPLSQYDHDYNVIPVLAERVPSIDDGTWVVSPDGPMRMTWRLRRNAKWHDGHPFTARDVRFSWEFNNDRSLPIIRRPIHNKRDGRGHLRGGAGHPPQPQERAAAPQLQRPALHHLEHAPVGVGRLEPPFPVAENITPSNENPPEEIIDG